MIKIKQILLSLCGTLTIISTIAANPIKLSDLNYKSASVLPYYYHHREKWAILPREAFGKDKGTCDDFGGSRDKGETHPVQTAGHELYEEAIASQTLGLTLRQTIDFINKNSTYIISYSDNRGTCNVTYITNFDHCKNQFFKNFYNARNNAPSHKYKEKDKIFIVKWKNLKKAIIDQANSFTNRWFGRFFNRRLTVKALELDPHTNQFNPANVTLRPFFVKKMRSFFLNKPYQHGMNKRIRHYNE